MSIYRDDLAQELDSPIGNVGVNHAGFGDNFDDKGPGYAYQPSLGAAFVSVGGRNEVSALATGGAGTLASPWTGWEAAVNALPVKSHIHFPAGYYRLATRFDIKDEWTVTGDGKRCTFLTGSMVGSSIRVGTSVSSAIGNIRISGLTIENTNASNTGSGILFLSMWLSSVDEVKIIGHRYGMALINTQVIQFSNMTVENSLVADMWLVAGGGDYNLTYADLDYSAYTGNGNNVLTWVNVQFQATTAVLVADDGGYNHRYVGCNFNGGASALRLADVNNISINAGIEGQTADSVICASTSFRAGTALGANGEVAFHDCTIIPNASFRAFDCGSQLRSLVLKGGIVTTNNPWTRNETATSIFIDRTLRGGSGAPFSGTPLSYLDIASDNTARTIATSLPIVTTTTVQTGGNVGIGVAPSGTTGQAAIVEVNGNQQTAVRVQNPNAAGTGAHSIFSASADVASVGLSSHSTARVVTRFGVAVGGRSEVLLAAGTGLNVGTLSAADLRIGTNSVAGLMMDATNPHVSFPVSHKRVVTQFDKTSDTTLADVTGLSVALTAGKTYEFEANLVTSSNAAGGVKFAIGGTATATAITYESALFSAGVSTATGTVRASALATAVGDITAVTVARCVIRGTITVNAAGTLTVQFAQNASNGTASSVLVGSTFRVIEAA